MKKKFTLAVLIMTVLAAVITPVNAAPQHIFITDEDMRFPVLKTLADDGYFSSKGMLTGQQPDKAAGDNNLFLSSSYAGAEAEESMLQFTLDIRNNINRNLRLLWKIPAEDAESMFYDESVSEILAIASETDKKNIHEIIQEKTGKTIQNIKAEYDDSGMSTSISRYTFTVNPEKNIEGNFWRTFSLIMIANSIGVANYWINKHDNMEDWKYKFTKQGIKDKFIDGWSFDTNAFRTNTIYHIYAGVVYYQAGRSTGYGYIASTAWAFAGSLVWEYLGEFREQVSSNDMVFTTMGGVILGEAFIECSVFLNKEFAGNYLAKTISFILDPMTPVNRLLDSWLQTDIEVQLEFTNPAQAFLLEKTGKHDRRFMSGFTVKY